jgi:hypothetical protein
MNDGQSAPQRAAKPLTDITTILCGIAATVAISELLSLTETNGIPSLHRPPLTQILLFIVSIITIVRFYLGNIRHLDEEYTGRYGKAHTKNPRAGGGKSLAKDFAAIVIESLVIVGLAYLLWSPVLYMFLHSVLLLIDSLWFFFVHKNAGERRKAWAANNFVFGIILIFISIVAVLLSQRSPVTHGWQQVAAVGIFALLASGNTFLDFLNEFDFYFPSLQYAPIIFLSASFTSEFTDGTFNETLKEDLERTIDFFRSNNYKVYNSHERETFGRHLDPPDRALKSDLDWIEESGLVIAVMTGDNPSPGVQMELGAALVLGKPIIQVIFPGACVPRLNRAFDEETFKSDRIVSVLHGDLSTQNLQKLLKKVDELCTRGSKVLTRGGGW